MRRRSVHGAFAALAICCALIAAVQGWRLRRAAAINSQIVAARLVNTAAVPQARFARAIALARVGDSAAAVRAYKDLIHSDRGELRTASLYNLGNLYLRQAERSNTEAASETLPLVELAKQSYRSLLRLDPGDWDARYNLERALWLAPEFDDTANDEQDAPLPEEHVSSTLEGATMDLP